MDVQGHLEPSDWIEEIGQELEDFWETVFSSAFRPIETVLKELTPATQGHVRDSCPARTFPFVFIQGSSALDFSHIHLTDRPPFHRLFFRWVRDSSQGSGDRTTSP